MSSTRSRSKQSNRNEFTRFLALESINKSRIINLQLYLGSRLYVGVIPLSCLMAKLGNGKGKCKQNVQSLPPHHAPNPMGRSKGTMRKTSQQLSTPTRLATEQTPETPSREHSTPTHPATEQKPEIPTDEDVAMHDPGNTSIVRCANALIRRANANANALNIAPTPSILQCANALHGAQTPSQTYTHTERKHPQRRDKDDSENSVSKIHRLLALANETLPVAKAAKTEKNEYESEQQSKRPRKLKKKPSDDCNCRAWLAASKH